MCSTTFSRSNSYQSVDQCVVIYRTIYCKSVSHANYRRLRRSGILTRNRYNIQLIRLFLTFICIFLT
ncbi:hypothetical protein Hanom_Chr03g00246771 [Helianthus anomalus]